MRQLLVTCLIVIIMLIGLSAVSVPILQPNIPHELPIHKTLYVDRNITDPDFDSIVSAASEWQYATHGLIKFDVVRLPDKNIDRSNSVVIVLLSEDFPEVISLDSQDPQESHLAYFERMGAIPYIGLVRPRIEDYEFKEVVMHELGHYLGLKHNLGEKGMGTLMYPDINLGSDTITDTDLKNLCKIYGCDASELHDE